MITPKAILHKYAALEVALQISKNDKVSETFIKSHPINQQPEQARFLMFANKWGGTGKNCFAMPNDLTTALVATDPLSEVAVNFPYDAFVLDVPNIKGLNQIGVFNNVKFINEPEKEFVILYVLGDTTNDNLLLIAPIDKTEFNKPKDLFGKTNIEFESSDKLLITIAHRLAYNFILWINAVKPAHETHAFSKPITKFQLTDIKNCPKEWIIGKNVKVSNELKKYVEEIITGTAPPVTKLTPQIRFMVRGHFRNQACGPSLTLRKLIWIEPFMKGPEGAEAWAHIYQASDKTLTPPTFSSTTGSPTSDGHA